MFFLPLKYLLVLHPSLHSDNFGSPVLFQWIERIKELLELWQSTCEDEKRIGKTEDIYTKPPTDSDVRCELKVTHGPLIQDRKSIFQGHACRATSQDDYKYT